MVLVGGQEPSEQRILLAKRPHVIVGEHTKHCYAVSLAEQSNIVSLFGLYLFLQILNWLLLDFPLFGV